MHFKYLLGMNKWEEEEEEEEEEGYKLVNKYSDIE
jgi:hypothetical protein